MPVPDETTHLVPKTGKDKAQLNTSISVVQSLFYKYWFILGLGITLVIATLYPDIGRKNGYLHSEWTIKWGAVILIFLISGLSMRIQTLAKTAMKVRLHLLIQLISLALIPLFVFGLVLFFFKVHLPLNSLLLVGVVITACTPTTISSNVVMTKNAGGNEASALMNSALGNILGIFVSPILVSTFYGPLLRAMPGGDPNQDQGRPLDISKVLTQLCLTVLVPLVIGQSIQWFFPRQVTRIKETCHFPQLSSLALLAMVLSVYSDTVYSGSFSSINTGDMVMVLVLNVVLYCVFSLLSFVLARLPLPQGVKAPLWLKNLRYSREDTIAVMYCGATKTVAMGVPLINILYQDGDAGTVGIVSTPLLMYHIEQLILGNIEIEILKRWLEKGRKEDAACLPSVHTTHEE
ncbi:putative sodium bile acid cotransporter [Spinellus fusiger]|nr:putative sodium bile acid cotransporter [Spinellus fusiger]